jgi:GTPase SAR1 family protein
MDTPTPYNINLDPAVAHLPYFANLDIRQTLNYKEIMKKHGLGPNGAILTSLNLYCTRFDQVLGIIDQRKDDLE